MPLSLRSASTRAGSVMPRGFTLIELLVVIAIIALLVGILLPAIGQTRKAARQAANVSNQKQLATASNNYYAEFREALPAFSWSPTRYGPLAPTAPVPTTDLLAAAAQAFSIIVRRATPDWPGINFNQVATNWIPHPTYTHLVLIDFLAARLPDAIILSPEDSFRINLARDPVRNGQAIIANPAQFGGMRPLWPFSSSYQWVTSSYLPNRYPSDGSGVFQAGDQIYYQYIPGMIRLGGRRIGDVRHPGMKVSVMEDVGRHATNREFFYTHPRAIVTCTFFDGSVRAIPTRDVNRGGIARFTNAVDPVVIDYTEQTRWGYPLWGTTDDRSQFARQRWTAFGLGGIDFGAGQATSDR